MSAGDRIPLKGVHVEVVASNGKVIAKPISGGGQPNPLCATAENKPPDVVNNGPRKGFGGPSPGSAKAQTAHYQRLATIPGVEGIWQEHLSLMDQEKDHNTAEDMIANFEDSLDCKGHWIRASVGRDGRFTVFNSRNGFSRTYIVR